MGFRGFILVIVSLLLGVVACQSENAGAPPPQAPPNEPSEKPSAQPVKGQIFGRPWAYLSGRADQISRLGSRYWVVSLYSEAPQDPCQYFGDRNLQVRLQFKESGNWNIPEEPFVKVPAAFFIDPTRRGIGPDSRGNIAANIGFFAVGSTEGPYLKGALNLSYSPSNLGQTEVVGAFSVPVCSRQNW